jgi:hypothetical protein
MSVQIKSLTNGSPVQDQSGPVPNDKFNLIPTAGVFFDLYTAPSSTTVRKGALVKGIRVLNAGAAPAQVSLYFNRPTPNAPSSRRLLAPPNIVLQPGSAYIDEGEIALEPGDKIQGKSDTANVIQYIISGIERDMT